MPSFLVKTKSSVARSKKFSRNFNKEQMDKLIIILYR
uniref:Uncharacterized protein n=1 Tax=Strigamia maritima TaxID=126957 RepID=T1JKT3_STRMM